jgi:hypothetical protein
LWRGSSHREKSFARRKELIDRIFEDCDHQQAIGVRAISVRSLRKRISQNPQPVFTSFSLLDIWDEPSTLAVPWNLMLQ